MRVTLTVHGQEHDGKEFIFSEPGSLVFGRSVKAQCQIAHDPYVSRSHFLLLINPPEVRLRNLSRTNGTLVDGVLYTQEGATVSIAGAETLIKGSAREGSGEAVLHDGSEIEAGYTKITIAVEASWYCTECGRPLARAPRSDGLPILCDECREKQSEAGTLAVPRRRSDGPARRPTEVEHHEPSLLPPHPSHGRSSPKETAPRPAARQAPPKGADFARQIVREILRKQRPEEPGLPDIPGHRIERQLVAGGMGVVLQATRLRDNRTVALKMIRPDRQLTPELLKRFRREIRITASLDHPHIIPLHDFGETGGVLWYTMEFVEGGFDMEKQIRQARGPLSPDECTRLMLEALDGLAYAHRRGIVHRDLKPPNILLPGSPRRRTAKLTDFGIAKSLEDTGLNGSVLTKPAIAMGTLPYMPPEQARDVRTCRPTADVFAMGATLYQMLTGKPIRDFSGNISEAVRQVLDEPPIPLLSRQARVPSRLAAVVDTALSMEPEERFPDADALSRAIQASLR